MVCEHQRKNNKKDNKKKKKAGSQKLVKPKFPKICPNTELYDLVTEESLEFFSIIKVDDNWWEQPVDSWEAVRTTGLPGCMSTLSRPTIWPREPSRRLLTTLTKDEDTRKRINQGVEDHRRTYLDSESPVLTIER